MNSSYHIYKYIHGSFTLSNAVKLNSYCPFTPKTQILSRLYSLYDKAEFWPCNVQMSSYLNVQ